MSFLVIPKKLIYYWIALGVTEHYISAKVEKLQVIKFPAHPMFLDSYFQQWRHNVSPIFYSIAKDLLIHLRLPGEFLDKVTDAAIVLN